MKFTAAFSLLAAMGAMAQTFSINTPPSLVQCQPVALSWTGGTAPFILAAIPGGQVSAAALETIATGVTGNSYTWVVNLEAGTDTTIKITDNTGTNVYDSRLTVQAGSDSSCLNATATSAAGAAGATTGAVTTTAAASGSSAAAGTTAAQSASSAAGQSTTAHSSAASASGTTASASKSSSTSTSASSAAASSGAAVMGSAVQIPALILAGVGAVAALF